MNITFKLFATLQAYLPQGASGNQIKLDVNEGSTPADLIKAYHLPIKLAHLVLVNGVYINPEERSRYQLAEGDVLAIWPPVAGG